MNKKSQAYAILAAVLILGLIVIVLLCIYFTPFKETLLELIGATKGEAPNIVQNITPT